MGERRGGHVAERFERLLETYRRPDGSRWTGARLAEATGGVVPRSYVTNLLKGRIGNPGYEKLAAMAGAMGFAPALWFDPPDGGDADPALEAALRDATTREIVEAVARLGPDDRRILLGVARGMARAHGTG